MFGLLLCAVHVASFFLFREQHEIFFVHFQVFHPNMELNCAVCVYVQNIRFKKNYSAIYACRLNDMCLNDVCARARIN